MITDTGRACGSATEAARMGAGTSSRASPANALLLEEWSAAVEAAAVKRWITDSVGGDDWTAWHMATGKPVEWGAASLAESSLRAGGNIVIKRDATEYEIRFNYRKRR